MKLSLELEIEGNMEQSQAPDFKTIAEQLAPFKWSDRQAACLMYTDEAGNLSFAAPHDRFLLMTFAGAAISALVRAEIEAVVAQAREAAQIAQIQRNLQIAGS